MKKFLFPIVIISVLLLPLAVMAAGSWKLSQVKRWPYRPNPQNIDEKIGQTIKPEGISYTYSYFDRNNSKQWLNNTVDFTWSFSTGNTTLRPGQNVAVYGTLTHTGKYIDNAVGGVLVGDDPRTESHGFRPNMSVHTWGYRAAWLLHLRASNGTTKGRNEFIVPTGPLPGGIPLTILFVTGIGGNAGVEYIYQWSSSSSTLAGALGKTLLVLEVGTWRGTWAVRNDGITYDAHWKNIKTGKEVRDILVLESIEGNRVTLFRKGNKGRYYGTLSADKKNITNGTASWYAPGVGWSAQISN